MKKSYILIILLISLLCIGSVSAADVSAVDVDDFDDDISVNDLSTPIDSSKTFSDIQSLIDNASEGDIINLDGVYSGDVIKVNKSVTIKGSDGTVIDGKNSSYRIFDISANNVVLKNLIICNADFKQKIEQNNYGTIYNTGDNLIIADCTFLNNTVYHPIGSMGGAIANYGKNVIVDNCKFENNHAYTEAAQSPFTAYGGAIANYGNNFTVKNSYFKSNIAHDLSDSGDMGGAIYSENDLTTVENCIFINNSANSGSAIYTTDNPINNKLIVKNCSFYNHTTNEAIGTHTFNVEIINSTFKYNSGSQGGALRIDSGYSVYIDGCTFIKNEAKGYDEGSNNGHGGAIIFAPGSNSNTSYTIVNSLFYKNIAEVAGSALDFSFLDNSNITINIKNNSFVAVKNNNVSVINLDAYPSNNINVNINNNIFDGYNSSVINASTILESTEMRVRGYTNSTEIRKRGVNALGFSDDLFELNVDTNYWSLNNTDSLPSSLVTVDGQEVSPNNWVLLSIYPETTPYVGKDTKFIVAFDSLCMGNNVTTAFLGSLPTSIVNIYNDTVSNDKYSLVIPSGESASFTSNINDTNEFNYIVASPITDKELARVNVKPIIPPNIHVVVIGDKDITCNVNDEFVIKYNLFNDGGLTKDLAISFRIPKGLKLIDYDVDYGTFSYSEQNEAYMWCLDELGSENYYLTLKLKAIASGDYQITPIVGFFEEIPSVVDSVNIHVIKDIQPVPKPTPKPSSNHNDVLPNAGNPLVVLLIALSVLGIGSLRRRF